MMINMSQKEVDTLYTILMRVGGDTGGYGGKVTRRVHAASLLNKIADKVKDDNIDDVDPRASAIYFK